MDFGTMNVVDLLNHSIQCECGRSHFAAINTVEISEGALDQVPAIVRNDGFKKPFIIADRNTYAIAGKVLLKRLARAGIPYSVFVFEQPRLSPNEQAIGSLLMHFDSTCDLIIGVGSGTINDISRFFSYRLGLQYYIVATAPSMDGYASTVAPLIKNNLKTTFECHVAQAIIADLDILAQAPKEMVAAGFGDVIGKYTCLADWKLSAIINGEYYCDKVVEITRQSLARTIGLRDGIANGDRKAIGELMETLILSGIAMSYVGNSRPASGSEHHLAHFWETRLLLESKQPVLHGAMVGISTILILKLYHYLLEENLSPTVLAGVTPPINDNWASDIEKVYLEAAPEVLLLEEKEQKNDPKRHQERLKSIIEHWDEILETLRSVPSPDLAVEILATVHAPTDPAQVGIEPQLVYEALLFGKEIRPRYTILQLLWDINLLSIFAEKIIPNFSDSSHYASRVL